MEVKMGRRHYKKNWRKFLTVIALAVFLSVSLIIMASEAQAKLFFSDWKIVSVELTKDGLIEVVYENPDSYGQIKFIHASLRPPSRAILGYYYETVEFNYTGELQKVIKRFVYYKGKYVIITKAVEDLRRHQEEARVQDLK